MKISVTDIIKEYCTFEDVKNFTINDGLTNVLIALKILSYFTVVIPLSFWVAYGISSLIGRVKEKPSLPNNEEIIQLAKKHLDKVKSELFPHTSKIDSSIVQIPLEGTLFKEKGPVATDEKKLEPLDTIKSIAPVKLQAHLTDKKNELTPFQSKYDIDDQKFFDSVRIWSIFKDILDEYISVISSTDKKWNTLKALTFLDSMIQALHGLDDELVIVNKSTNTKLIEAKLNSESEYSLTDIQQLLEISTRLNLLHDTYLKAISIIKEKLSINKETIDLIKGLTNDGNTCYINSALQPLLAIGNLTDLVPQEITQYLDENEETFKGRQIILSSFKKFLKAWEMNQSSKDLGKLIGGMRKTIFTVGLFQGGFLDKTAEYEFQDAGQFYENILYVIGRGFQLKNTRIPCLDNGTQLEISRIESNKEGVFILDIDKNKSVQDGVNRFLNPRSKTFKEEDAWRVEHPSTKEQLRITKYVEECKIEGRPAECMVFRVQDYCVDPTLDLSIDCSSLFEEKLSPNEATYELVGFSQNHGQVHWTSVVRDGTTWKYCNDSFVKKIDSSNQFFKDPAHYLVYRKKQ